MNQVINKKGARNIALAIALCYLIIHIILILLFYYNGVTPMVYFNIFSISFYAAMVIIVIKSRLLLFVAATYLEVMTHMTLSVYFTGWGSGFQITMICMMIQVFFAEYLGRSIDGRYVRALPFALLGMILYLGTCVVSYLHKPAYSLPSELSFWLQISWGVIVFVISIACLELFVYFSFHSEKILSEQVVKDKLTGLPNRYYISAYLDKLAESDEKAEYWMAMADIDDFKAINDTYGHIFGDYVLKTIADLIIKSGIDMEFCRWGGEEFLMVGKVNGDIKKQYENLDDFRRKVENHKFSFEGNTVSLTLTIGVTICDKELSNEEWVKMADRKLYEGKCSGKNKVVL